MREGIKRGVNNVNEVGKLAKTTAGMAKNPPPAHSCMRGGRGRGNRIENPPPARGRMRERWRRQTLTFSGRGPRSAPCTDVGSFEPCSTSLGRCRPCVGYFRPYVGLFNPASDCWTMCWALSSLCWVLRRWPVQTCIGSIEHPLAVRPPCWVFRPCAWRFDRALAWGCIGWCPLVRGSQ